MKHIVIYIIIGITLLSCSERQEYVDKLEQAQGLLDEHPDSALQILDSLSLHEQDFSKSFRMKYQLLKLQAQNKADAKMDTINIVPEVADYYASHGSHHDKMMANYMMGRYYADKGDAPRALQYYREAVSYSDTTKADCDYKNLSRIYGQMATLFHMQRSPRLELNAERKAESFASKANDNMAALIFHEHIADAYYMMNMMDSVLYYYKETSDLFRKYGYNQLLAGIEPLVLEIYLNRNDTNTAKKLINHFEQEAGAFDDNNEIEPGREYYYSMKGLYFEKVHNIDSALFYYQKLLRYNSTTNNVESAYKGLLSVYNTLAKPDSVLKYAKLFADANDSANLKHSAEEINRLQTVYNYNESLYIANTEKEKAQKRLLLIYVIIGCAIISGLILAVFIRSIQKRRRLQLISMSRQYADLLNKFIKARQDLTDNQEGYDKYRNKKEIEIEELKQALSVFQEDNSRPEMWDIEDALLNSAIVKSMHSLASRGKAITDVQWEDFENLVSSKLNTFYIHINDSTLGLTDIEKKISMLIRLRFIPSELAVLLDLSKQRITNIRTAINMKLFKEKGTKSLDANIRKLR